jgi:sodium/proline symporter
MAAKNPDEMITARRTGMSWMIIVLFGSVASGLAGVILFAEEPLDNPETVFIALNQSLFNPWVAGVITAAILSAIMSTVDSQLLVSASVISEDFYRVFFRPRASQAELILVSRVAVICVACVALWIASDRNNNVLNLVSYAWAGFGSAFGPVIIFSLLVRDMTSRSAVFSMFVGASTVIVWSKLEGGVFDLYEMIPGFAAASLSIILFCKFAPEKNPKLLKQFDDIKSEINSS